MATRRKSQEQAGSSPLIIGTGGRNLSRRFHRARRAAERSGR
jgi:hypothetical protein